MTVSEAAGQAFLSAIVVAALVTGVFGYLINRLNARVIKRKNNADERNDLVGRYRAMASEERAAKESAVSTMSDLLAIAESQIATLRVSIAQLSDTIEVLQRSAASQHDMITGLRQERDRLTGALHISEARISVQRAALTVQQVDLSRSIGAPNDDEGRSSYG